MRFCQPHWDQLKAAIKAKGLWDFVAADGPAAMVRMQAELSGTETPATYDPLMAANWMICGQALEQGGLYLLSGDYCPLCEANIHAGERSDAIWIDGCTDACLDYCKEHGLIK